MEYIAEVPIAIKNLLDILYFNPQFPIFWWTKDEPFKKVMLIFWFISIILVLLPDRTIQRSWIAQLLVFHGQLLFFSYPIIKTVVIELIYLKSRYWLPTQYYYTPFFWIVWVLSLLFLLLWWSIWSQLSSAIVSSDPSTLSISTMLRLYVYALLFAIPLLASETEVMSFTWVQLTNTVIEDSSTLSEIDSVFFVIGIVSATIVYARFAFKDRQLILANTVVLHLSTCVCVAAGWATIMHSRSAYNTSITGPDNEHELMLASMIIFIVLAYFPLILFSLEKSFWHPLGKLMRKKVLHRRREFKSEELQKHEGSDIEGTQFFALNNA
ncbi:MAG: hypothetical protein ACTSYA_03575 [Candidatus Kariarchaeaceae archaeon]